MDKQRIECIKLYFEERYHKRGPAVICSDDAKVLLNYIEELEEKVEVMAITPRPGTLNYIEDIKINKEEYDKKERLDMTNEYLTLIGKLNNFIPLPCSVMKRDYFTLPSMMDKPEDPSITLHEACPSLTKKSNDFANRFDLSEVKDE